MEIKFFKEITLQGVPRKVRCRKMKCYCENMQRSTLDTDYVPLEISTLVNQAYQFCVGMFTASMH